jgi:hypothetical protein
MVRAPNQGAARAYSPVKRQRPNVGAARPRTRRARARSSIFVFAVGSETPYLAPVAVAYLRRNLSTRPAVSTIFCLPV